MYIAALWGITNMEYIDLGYWVNSFIKHGDFAKEQEGQYLSEAAYRNIYKKIVTLEYGPGKILNEKQLIEELGLGRTPIREAVRSLASNGIVELHPSKAILVRPITIQNTKALFSAMDILEQSIARNIFLHDLGKELKLMKNAQEVMKRSVKEKKLFEILMANHVFHMAFYHASRNEYLIYGLKRVRFEAERLGFISFSVEIFKDQPVEELYQILIADHQEIMDLLSQRDFSRLQEAIFKHNRTFRKRILEYLSPEGSFQGTKN
jgi:DNA-binding GntR family transcriptional regulator